MESPAEDVARVASPAAALPVEPSAPDRLPSKWSWRLVDAYFQWSNTYYAWRVAVSTLLSAFSLGLLFFLSADKSFVLWIWGSIQLLNVLLGVASLPFVSLYVTNGSSDATDATATSRPSEPTDAPPSANGRPYQPTDNTGKTAPASATSLPASPATNGRRRYALVHTPALYVCEIIVIFQTFSLAWVIMLYGSIYWAFGELTSQDTLNLLRPANLLVVLSAAGIMLQTREFDRLRAHQQLQLGAGLEEDDLVSLTGASSSSRLSVSGLAKTPNEDASTPILRSNVAETTYLTLNQEMQLGASVRSLERSLRYALYEATLNGDHVRVGKLLRHAETVLGSKLKLEMLLTRMYNTPILFCWAFAHRTRNPLHVACRAGDVELVEMLLEAGINPNFLDKTAGASFDLELLYDMCQLRFRNIAHVLGSPMHVAVEHGHTDVIDLLVKFDANLDVIARTSFFSKSMRVTPVFLGDSVDVVENLIYHRANILVVPGKGDSMSTTVLQRAQLNGRRELASVLAEWGADVALTPLHEAAAAGDLATVSHLLAWEVDPNVLGEFQEGVHRRTPLHWAAVMGRKHVIAALLLKGADVNAKDSHGRTPLHWATRHNYEAAVKELLANHADPRLTDHDGLTPLAFGVLGGILGGPCVEMFVEAGVNVSERISNENLDTPLHLALRLGHRDVALALLVEGQADLYAVNGQGRRAIECCASAELQYAVKVAGNCVDVVLSFDPAFRLFANRVRAGIEQNYITVFMREDGDDIEHSKQVIEQASALVCMLSDGYERTIAMAELVHAKELEIPGE